MKKYQCLFFIIAAMSSLCYGMQDSTFETNGVKWKKDSYGNLLPNVLDVPAHELSAKLSRFIASLKDRESGNAFIVQLPHEQSDRAVALFQAGFTPYFVDAAKTEWVIKNGSPMPEAATAAAGARVLILRGEEVLVIEDKNIKGRVMFPGGSVDKAELALDAAVREISEEVGLKVRPNDLKKIALTNRVRANRHGTSDYCHYYLARDFTGDMQFQESEILQAFWCPLAQIAAGETINGLKVSPTIKLLADHVLKNGPTSSRRALDPRQYSAAQGSQNISDIMDIDLFQINKQACVDEGKRDYLSPPTIRSYY